MWSNVGFFSINCFCNVVNSCSVSNKIDSQQALKLKQTNIKR